MLAISALFIVSLSVQWSAGDIGDKCWLLLAARKWIEGGRLYRDIFESNPPLIIWLYSLPAYLSLHLPVRDYLALVMLGLCLAALSVTVSVRLLAFHAQLAGDAYKRAQFAFLLLFILCFYTSPAYFADREHLFFMLALPYLLRWMPSIEGKLPIGLRVATGAMAAIGFCIKPQLGIIFVTVQLLYFLQRRSAAIVISRENIIIYAIACCYLLSVWCFTQEYVFVVLPMLLQTYSSYKVSPIMSLLWSGFILAIPFADFRLRYTQSPYRRDIVYILGVCAGCLGYALLNNGWGYTFIPLDYMIFIATCFVYWEYLWLRNACQAKGEPCAGFIFGARACLCSGAINAASVVLVMGIAYTSHCRGFKECSAQNDVSLLMQEDEAHSFGTLTIDWMLWTHLAKNNNLVWVTRFNTLWMLPKIVTGDSAFVRKNQWIVSYVGYALAQDIGHNKPDIMIVDDSPQFYKTQKHMDLVKYFSVFADFKDAWSHYRLQTSIDFCNNHVKSSCRYAIYRRGGPA